MRTRLRPWMVALTTSIAALPVGAARAEPPPDKGAEEARVRLDKGGKLYKEGAYQAALIEFQRAYEISGNYKILYNMALVSMYVKDFATALRHYQVYVAKGGAEIPGPRRAEVEREIARLEGLVAKLDLAGAAAGAELRIDDEPAGTAPFTGPFVVNPGKHKVEIVKAGHEPVVKVLVLAAGESVKVDIQLAPKAAAPKDDASPLPLVPLASIPPVASGEPVKPPAPPSPAPSSFPWPAWVITGALAAGTATMGALTLTKYGALSDERHARQATTTRLDDLATTTKTYAVVADVLGGLTIASTAVSIYLTARRTGDTAPPKTTSLHVGVGPGAASIAVGF